MRFWILFFLYAALFLSLKCVWPLTGDFFLLAVITFGFLDQGRRTIWLVWLLGLFFDVVSLSPLGASIFAYSLVFFVIRLLRAKIFFQSLVAKFIWIAVFSLLSDWGNWAWTFLFTEFDHPFWFIIKISLWNAFVNGLLGLFWIDFLSWYWQLTESESYGTQTRSVTGA